MQLPRSGQPGGQVSGDAGTLGAGVPPQPGTGQRAEVPAQPGTGQWPASDIEQDVHAAESALASIVGRAWLAILAAAAGVFAAGLILLIWPGPTLTVVAILLGAALIVTGLMRLFEGFTAEGESGGTRAAYVLIGLVATIAGLFCLRNHDVTVFLLAFVVGVFWVIHGAADVGVAVTAGPVPGRGLRAIMGVVAVAAGLVVMFWPGVSLVLMLTIFGAWLMFYGVVLAGLALRVRRAAHPA